MTTTKKYKKRTVGIAEELEDLTKNPEG